MAERDFRSFLEILRREGELTDVTEPVSLTHELAARVDASERADNKAFLFRAVSGHTIPVAAGLYGSTRRHLLGLRMQSMAEFADRLEEALRAPVEPEVLRGSLAPCQEVRLGETEGVDRLPVPIHFPGDAGPYITSGVVTMRDRHRRNVGIYRIQVHGPRRLTILANRYHDGHRVLDSALTQGRSVDVAISIGVDPAIFISAFWPCRPDIEEFAVASALMGQSVLLAPALTVDIEIPAHAEIVIEGQIRPGNEEIEGPFADITGQITSSGKQPVIDITAITTRRNLIYHTVLGFNSREHFKSRSSDFWRDYQATGRVKISALQETLGNDYRIYFPPVARNFHAVVSLKKSTDEQPRHIIEAVFQSSKYLKRVVVVDDDIDITDLTQVEWALATRVGRPEQVIINTGLGSRIDKSTNELGGQVIKMGIDATVPMALRAEVLRPGLGEAGYSTTPKK